MLSVHACPLPGSALLTRHARDGAFTDCYATELPAAVTQAQYVAAFYTSPVFKLERFILKWALSRPATDAQALQLAQGSTDAFSAWTVEARADDQLLLCDMTGRTRSWLMVEPLPAAQGGGTRLYFGSAVLPVRDRRTGQRTMGLAFRALLGFHKLYSVVLLAAARSRLAAR